MPVHSRESGGVAGEELNAAMNEVTRILKAVERGDLKATDEFLPVGSEQDVAWESYWTGPIDGVRIDKRPQAHCTAAQQTRAGNPMGTGPFCLFA